MGITKPKGLYLLGMSAFDRIYGADTRRDIEAQVEIVAPLQTPESIAADPAALADVSLIFSGWGMARVDEALLDAAPNLEAIFYAAGSVRYFVTDAMWERDVRLTSGYGANAEFVAPFTLAQIILSLKRVWHFANKLRKEETYNSFAKEPLPGLYTGVVGLISLGQVGRRVAALLQQTLSVRVLAYDPYLTPETAAALGVEPVGLDELFRSCDVVSLHTPWLPQTVGMIRGAHLASMKANATFINTARGAVVNEPEMIAVLQQRPDLYALLDVTYPEPPVAGSPLYSLPNVLLTPHIAGAHNTECLRMGRLMAAELSRYLVDERLEYEITQEALPLLA
jgi:phosphoglycerate dehydrogenase-like enzyme